MKSFWLITLPFLAGCASRDTDRAAGTAGDVVLSLLKLIVGF